MDPAKKRPAPWKGRSRTASAKTSFVRVRYEPEARAEIEARGRRRAMTLSDFIRHVTEGQAGRGRRRKPPVEIVS